MEFSGDLATILGFLKLTLLRAFPWAHKSITVPFSYWRLVGKKGNLMCKGHLGITLPDSLVTTSKFLGAKCF